MPGPTPQGDPEHRPEGGAGHLPFEQRFWPTERYRSIHRQSVRDVAAFWEPIARDLVRWQQPFRSTLEGGFPHPRWFVDGRLNLSENCLDRHLSGPTRNKVALYWEGEDGATRTLSYEDLAREVQRIASALSARGFSARDYAAVYLPMVPELPITMLALARLGIPFTTVFSGFSAAALGERIRRLGARLLVTSDGGYRRGAVVPLKAIADEALQESPSVELSVVVRRTGEPVEMRSGRDVTWEELRSEGRPSFPAVPVASDHPLFLLYSSGTTGHPKAIVHGTGGYLVHTLASLRWVFDPRPEDVYWCAADIGWVTGHSYIVFGPLGLGLTSVLYEGALDHPQPDRLWSMIERYRVSILYTSPTALRGLRTHGDAPVLSRDLGSLRILGTVGEAINPAVWEWYFRIVGRERCPIVDTWWQTETGAIMISPAPGLGLVPMKPGSATYPLPGIDADVVTEKGAPAAPGEKGFAVVYQPWPGMLQGLHGEEERYLAGYFRRFPGAYYAGDYAVRDHDGYFWFLGRADEVLKVAGHRLGTIEIEDAILSYPGVAEAAVCGRSDPVKGEVPVAFVVLKRGHPADAAVASAVAAHVAALIGKIARPEEVHLVHRLPKTRSGKIMRRVVRAVAEGQADVGDTTTLEDDATVEEVRAAIARFTEELRRAR